ncbi:flagellar basal-body rod protein FlgF [Crenalkalicoccus roseus]|uniref:flagellar basal-body rod protein FlgF n=1 Tax=Crenalkalicoccus roseus TaxID=1485588 RepID=UPI00108216B3|nr:flagellar basal-body rod protein FlgF [Crenalkalicoccus roseus]
MDTPGYVILSRLGAQLRATQVLANNVANADTPGFRAERAIFVQHLERHRDLAAPPGQREVAYALDRATWRDMAPGAVSVTGNPLDVAIQGEGFFAVETPRGERYTRAGRFALDAERRLVDAEGHPVLDARGMPIAFAINDSRIEIRGDGTVRTENGAVGQLRVVRFADPQRLQAEGGRLFASDDPPEPVERPALVQGAVEGSNVSAVQEITRLTIELREFQFAAQFAEREGERLQTAVERILRRR